MYNFKFIINFAPVLCLDDKIGNFEVSVKLDPHSYLLCSIYQHQGYL